LDICTSVKGTRAILGVPVFKLLSVKQPIYGVEKNNPWVLRFVREFALFINNTGASVHFVVIRLLLGLPEAQCVVAWVFGKWVRIPLTLRLHTQDRWIHFHH
jgi:hypothetical protein